MEKLKRIGFWIDPDRPNGMPDPRTFVAASIDDATKAKVVEHLTVGKHLNLYRGLHVCRMCGAHKGTTDMTDGEYIWPQGLPHYITEHNVWFPAEVIEDLALPCPSMPEIEKRIDQMRAAELDI